MQVIADLHLHSKYSQAVSKNMVISTMAQVAKQKGIDLLATGDWTHPQWFQELRTNLVESEEGIFKIKKPTEQQKNTRFLLSVEVSNIYSQAGKGRRIHNLLWSPSFESAEKINKELMKRGYNISSDGRPILGLSSRDLLEMVLGIDDRCLLIPCHIWTPWFGLYGMNSGFQSLQEGFADLSDYVYGIETGLSSDPEMNWQIAELNTRSILSFSDAHSPAKMGREATIFILNNFSYTAIREAVMEPYLKSKGKKVENKVLYTFEFYPEEGKYHYSGHRKCNVIMTPEDQQVRHGICPVCKRKVTDGVMRRVQELANENPRSKKEPNISGLTWFIDPQKKHPPFVKMVPLLEIVAEGVGTRVSSLKAQSLFNKMCNELDTEINILLNTPLKKIKKVAGEKIAEGIQKVREGNIMIKPGFDGVYGTVKIWHEVPSNEKESHDDKTQLGLDL